MYKNLINCFHKRKRFFYTLLILFLSISSFAQQKITVSGTVISDSNQVLSSVSVKAIGMPGGTTTDAHGAFTLKVNKGAILVFSFIDFESKEIKVETEGKALNVQLISKKSILSDVVVVGYGTQKKTTLTGSVVTIKGDVIQKATAPNISNSLAGRLPGLVVVTRTGEPGNDASMLRIRGVNTLGDNSPLIIVDGIANRGLDRIDPASIESISVLKDASAAIYGSAAANGVILITTKRGSTGKPQLTINMNEGMNTPTVLPKMANSADYAQMINEIKEYAGQPDRYTAAEIQLFKDGSQPWLYPNTDWFKATVKPLSAQRYINSTLSGGTEAVKYFVSLGSNYQDGIYYNSGSNYSQVNFLSNLDVKVSKNVRLSIDVTGRQQNTNKPGAAGNGALDPYWAMNRAYPYLPARWPNGLPGPDVEYGANSTVITTDATGYQKNTEYVIQGKAKLDINIPGIPGLTLTGIASVDRDIQVNKHFTKPWYLYTWDRVSYDANKQPLLVKGKRGPDQPTLSEAMSNGGTTTFNGLINYTKTIAKNHAINILAGTERIVVNTMSLYASRNYFTSAAIDELSAGGDLLKDNWGTSTSSARLGYFGRFNYGYKSKYLAEFVWRYDGSYIFPQDKRYGFFPGISLGWRISQENFWKNIVPIVNELKIRGSWGKTGNDRIEANQFLASYGFSSTAVFNQNVAVKGLSELRIPNPNVTWEVANQSNIGFDAQLFNGRLNITGDYFYNLRTNILWWKNASVPATTGLSLPRQNIGKVANRGFELMLAYNNKIGEVTYNVSVNGAYTKNKILFWDETPGVPDYQKSTGYPVGSALYYHAIGIFRDQKAVDAYPHWAGARPGDIRFEDKNGDGKIDGLDLVRDNKTDVPTFTGGWNLDVGYKNFYTSILVQGAAGAERSYRTFSGEAGNFLEQDVQGRWTTTNMDAVKPRTWNRSLEYWMTDGAPNNTYWLRSSDYIRLKNIEVGYNLPKTLMAKYGMQGIRVYVSAQNLITKTPMKDWDPESPNDSPGSIWVNSEVYPLNKTYTVGLSVKF